MKVIQDDRTEQEKEKYIYFVQGHDTFLSGWGGATGGKSYATWACNNAAAWHKKLEQIKARTDMADVVAFKGNIELEKRLENKKFAHYHVYKSA
jgi:hypothetical protein